MFNFDNNLAGNVDLLIAKSTFDFKYTNHMKLTNLFHRFTPN